MAAGVGSNSDAVEFGDVVVLAVSFAAIEATLDDAGSSDSPMRARHTTSGFACSNARLARGQSDEDALCV
jgi:NADP oxidoreductase coenzyme F420-dependent